MLLSIFLPHIIDDMTCHKTERLKNLRVITVLMTIFSGDLKIMGNSLDCNMMPTKTSENLFKKILSIKCHYLPVIYNRKFFVHDDNEMANRSSVLIN